MATRGRLRHFWAVPCVLVLAFIASQAVVARAEQIAVRYPETPVRGSLVLRSVDGRILANGDLTQTLESGRLTAIMVFRFIDGSFREETTVYTQDGQFRLLSHHVLRKGPAFAGEVETWLDALTGEARVRYVEGGKEKMVMRRLDLDPDVANGLLFPLLKNVDPAAQLTVVSMVGFTPQPRIVKLEITPEQEASQPAASQPAHHFRVHVDLGTATGFVARLVGKQPPDIHMWIAAGDKPEFVRFEGPLYENGPVWRMEPSGAFSRP
jgi:hypothetical protein